MIYYSADDYGLCDKVSKRIEECIEKGVLNKISVFPNYQTPDFSRLSEKEVCLALHLNLVEGKSLAENLELITDEKGNFKFAFGGLLFHSLFNKKNFEKQIYKEIKAQVSFWKQNLPGGSEFCVDSHQHTHLIPVIFKMLIKVLAEEKINVKYLRIPAEPIIPFLKTPSLYLTYSAVNVIKQWLLNFLWLFDKKEYKKSNIPSAYFFGVLLSGKMDEKRVKKILPHYIQLANKKGRDIEVLFHPAFLEETELEAEVRFKKFYLSKNRKTEFNSAINLKGV